MNSSGSYTAVMPSIVASQPAVLMNELSGRLAHLMAAFRGVHAVHPYLQEQNHSRG